jgi:exopolysaccharide biosynthesis polyprenyl glycosylphosphotransferase
MIGSLIVLSSISLVVSLLATPVVRSLAVRLRIGDYPGDRKIHDRFIPRMGGVGIIAGFACGGLAGYFLLPMSVHGQPIDLRGVGVALLVIVALGIYDDVHGIGSFGKLTVQLVASALAVVSGLRVDYLALPFVEPLKLGIFSTPLTLLWLVGVTNAVNLLDGLDGLAAGVAAIVAATMFSIGLSSSDGLLIVTTASLFFAAIGFLRYNFHPASIFMGDTGSLFLGFLLACLSLRLIQDPSRTVRPITLLVAVAALAVPIVDTSVAFFRRLKRGMHPLKADKEHIHHRLMDLGLTHRQTVVAIYAISAFNGTIALLLVHLESLYSAILLLILSSSVFVGIRRLGYVEEMSLRERESSPPIQPLSVARAIDRAVLIIGDVTAILLAFLLSYWLRFHSGFFAHSGYVPLETYVQNPTLLILAIWWLIVFLLAGLYEIPWDLSRIDYGVIILKAVSFGTLVVFLATLDLENLTVEGRLTTLLYGSTVAFFVLLIRMLIVAFERKHEILGFRRRNTLIVGTTRAAQDLVQEIANRPGLKYGVVGFVDRVHVSDRVMDLPVLGNHESIPHIVKQHQIEEILVATNYTSREEILDILARCNGMVQNVKVVPESTDLLSGFKTEEIIGHPLIRVFPTNLKTWQRLAKRSIDIGVAVLVLLPFLPLWVLVGVMIVLDSRGPVFFTQERVGKKGRMFKLYKFRSMVFDAERETGPVWATPDDKRVTRVGKILRKLRLDEVPQFINVLKGEMSLVGPRPERPYFVEQLKKEVKFYTRRLIIRPGITGWSQVRHRYDRSLEDVKAKIQYDLYYLENMSLTLDFKIILRTIIVALSGKGTN